MSAMYFASGIFFGSISCRYDSYGIQLGFELAVSSQRGTMWHVIKRLDM